MYVLPSTARRLQARARCTLILSLAGCGLSVGPTTLSEAAKPRCDHIRGHRVLTTGALKVVRRPFRQIYKKNGTQVIGNALFACARPRGGVHKIASSSAEYLYPGTTRTSPVDSTGVSIRATAGTFVILATQSANLTGDYAEKTNEVVNGATGARYRFFHALMSPGGPSKPETGPPSVVKLNSLGQLAGIFDNSDDPGFRYSDPGPGQAEVIAFNAHGARTILDQAPAADIPTASLTLTAATVTWVNKGRPRTATIR